MSCGQAVKLNESKLRRWGRRSWRLTGKRRNLAGSEPGKPQQVLQQAMHSLGEDWTHREEREGVAAWPSRRRGFADRWDAGSVAGWNGGGGSASGHSFLGLGVTSRG